MARAYTRQSSFLDGDIILAEHGNAEFDELVEVFNESTGHNHDGTTQGGSPVPLVQSPDGTKQIRTTNQGVEGNLIDNDVALTANSEFLLATQRATKSYVDSNIQTSEANALRAEAAADAASGFAGNVGAPTVLAEAMTINIPDGTSRMEIFCLGLTGTVNLPATPGASATYIVRTHREPTGITINTNAGANDHDIEFIDGDTETNASIQGDYDLILYWDGTEYKEIQ